MVRSGRWRRCAAGVALAGLAGCATLSQVFSEGTPVEVSEIRSLAACNSSGPAAQVSLLASRDAVDLWQQSRGVKLIGVDPLPEAGAYALVEMGQRPSAGYGIAVSRQARVDDGVIHLSATLFSPDPGQTEAQVVTSPCALVALPAGGYRGVVVRDPSGALLARTDVAAPVQ